MWWWITFTWTVSRFQDRYNLQPDAQIVTTTGYNNWLQQYPRCSLTTCSQEQQSNSGTRRRSNALAHYTKDNEMQYEVTSEHKDGYVRENATLFPECVKSDSFKDIYTRAFSGFFRATTRNFTCAAVTKLYLISTCFRAHNATNPHFLRPAAFLMFWLTTPHG